jgi:hypothetical protein
MGFAPKTRVRTGLAAGGSRNRTISPPLRSHCFETALFGARSRFAGDSPLEGAGFEPPVPLGEATVRDRFASF